MIRFFAQLTLGHYRRHRLEGLLCLVGVALGVAVMVAIDGAVRACVSSFEGAVQSLAGRSTHAVFAEQGTIPDQAYIDLVRRKLPYPMAPVLERSVLVRKAGSPAPAASWGVSGDGVVGRLIGVDVFSERSLRSFTRIDSELDEATRRRFLTEPGEVVLVDALAGRLGVAAGDTLHLTVGGKRVSAHVAGVVKPTGVARSQVSDVIVADLATAQELTGSLGRLDRIDVRLESDDEARALQAVLPPGLVLRSTQQQASSLSDLIGSYRLNLAALSLMASFVAVFIVYNSMLISVQQRATSLGILRCLGGSRVQLASIYLFEAVAFALVGGAIGVAGGWLLARGLVGYVATTINDLYAAVRPGPVVLGPQAWGKGFALAVVSCLAGAALPLWRASRTPPLTAFRDTERVASSRRRAVRLLLIGAALLAASYGLYVLPVSSPVIGFVMAVGIATAFALACPAVTAAAARGVDALAARSQLLPVRMAASGVSRSAGVTGVAVAAVMLALSMTVGVRTMSRSFRNALDSWVEQRFAADVFVAPELLVNHKVDATLDPAVVAWVKSRPQVAAIVDYRQQTVPIAGKPTLVVGSNVTDLLARRTLPLKQVVPGGRPFDPASDVLVSEPLSGRAKVGAGDVLRLNTPTGPHRFTVYAVFHDFGNERGQVMLQRPTFAADWKDDQVNSLHVRLRPGTDADAVAADWSRYLRADYPVVVDSFRALKGEILTVFDRTFAVTNVLAWLAGGVAFCGMAGSLLSMAIARRRDYGVLAALGMSGRQTAAWVLAQGLLIAAVAAALAAVAGTVLAYVLSYVIQYRSFGWSIPTSPQPRFWLEAAALAAFAALAAAIYPVYRLRRTPPAGTLRRE